MQAGERGHRPAGPEQTYGFRALGVIANALGEGFETSQDRLPHAAIAIEALLFAVVGAGDGVGQGNNAPGNAHPVENARHCAAGFDQHQLGRPAADIENHRRPGPVFEQDVAPQHRQPCLFLRADDVESDAGFLTHALDEFCAIGSAAAGLGGDRAGKMHVAAAQLFRADLKRGKRAIHRFVRQAAAGSQPFAKPDHTAEGIDDGEVLARGPCDQQAAIVRAKVKRGIGLLARPGKLRWGVGRSGAIRGSARVCAMRIVPRGAGALLGPGGALVAKIGYLAGRFAPFFTLPPFHVRRRLIRHGAYFRYSSHAKPYRAGT